MAERERLTKKERRERARAERREQEKAAVAAERRRRVVTIVTVIAVVAGVAALFVFTREEPAPTDIAISRTAAEQAREAASCEPQTFPEYAANEHLSEPAPPASQLYAQRPTAGGPHYPAVHPIGSFDEPIDERLTTHNMEHGSVIVWYRPGFDGAGELREWAELRNRAGFRGQSGAGIIAAPFEAPEALPEGVDVALRAWGEGLNCATFDATVADAFLIDHFGGHGTAPEAFFGEYPEDALYYEGEKGAPQQEQPPAGTEAPMTPEATEPAGGATEASEPAPAQTSS